MLCIECDICGRKVNAKNGVFVTVQHFDKDKKAELHICDSCFKFVRATTERLSQEETKKFFKEKVGYYSSANIGGPLLDDFKVEPAISHITEVYYGREVR